MSKEKFKVGERYEVVKPLCFYLGEIIEIVNIKGNRFDYKIVKSSENRRIGKIDWFRKDSMKYKHLKPVTKNETIVIYRKDSEVIALDKRTGNKAVAKCHPEDEFNFETGAKLAFERLLVTGNFDNGNKSNKYNTFDELISRNISWRNHLVELKEGYEPAEILKQYDSIKVGDTVKIIDRGSIYSSYSSWSGLGKHLNKFIPLGYPDLGKNHVVLNVAPHETQKRDLVLIQNPDSKQVFIFNLEGVEKVK